MKRAALLPGAMAGVVAFAMAQAAPPARELAGTVTRVVDGDTVWLAPAAGGAPVVVRIEGIDAPESCQAWGTEAQQALGEKLLNQAVRVRTSARDDYGRTVGRVFLGDLDVGDRLVRDGHAWSMRLRSNRGPYMSEERMAIALKRGLHAEAGALLPREFRQRHGDCVGAGGPASAPASTPAAASRAASARR